MFFNLVKPLGKCCKFYFFRRRSGMNNNNKKLVMRLPNFSDRRIRYGSFLKKISSQTNKNNLKFFQGGDRSRGSFFIILNDLKQLLPRKPCAILYLFKDRVANPYSP